MAYWTAELPLVSLEAIQQQIRQSTNHHFMLVACEGNTVIGTLTFAQSDKPRLCHVGRISQVVVHQTYRGRGIGIELMRSLIELADSWLNLKRLELLVYTDNDPTIHLYSKFGFISEGILRQNLWLRGGNAKSGNGRDFMHGGAGKDVFQVRDFYLDEGYVKIADFSRQDGDKVQIKGSMGDYVLRIDYQETRLLHKASGDLVAVFDGTNRPALDVDFQYVS